MSSMPSIPLDSAYHIVHDIFDKTTLTCGICMYEWSCIKCYNKIYKSLNNKKVKDIKYETCDKCNTMIGYKI
jgi:formate dehydrogenase maturation protein FdhE